MTLRDFYYSRVVTDFYQSMTRTTRGPPAFHFRIDGRSGTLEARHIAEALQIPLVPERAAFRPGEDYSELEQASILSRGRSTG